MVQDGANIEDIAGYLNDKNFPADNITLNLIADKILQDTPKQGYLTTSNASQCRLQYGGIVKLTETVDGISTIINKVTK